MGLLKYSFKVENLFLVQLITFCYAFSATGETIGLNPRNFTRSRRKYKKLAMTMCHEENLEYLKNNHMWTLVELPKNQNMVGCNCVLKKTRRNTKCGEGKIQDMNNVKRFSTNEDHWFYFILFFIFFITKE